MNGVKFLLTLYNFFLLCIVVVYQSSGNNGNNISTLLSSGEQGMINNVMREMKRLFFRVYRCEFSSLQLQLAASHTNEPGQTTTWYKQIFTCNQTIGSFVLTQIGHHCSHLLFFRVS